MGRRFLPLVVVVGLLVGACGSSGGRAGTPTRITVGATGPLAAGLVTQNQVRQVPAMSTAKITTLAKTTVFEDPDPRGPCGAKVPVISLQDAIGVAITTEELAAVQLIARLPTGAAKAYLDARMANTVANCPEYETVTHQKVTQRVKLVRIVRLHREFEQALAVVTALKVAERVRAATQIEMRRNDILSRVVIFSARPLNDNTVRGIAGLMGRNLLVFDNAPAE